MKKIKTQTVKMTVDAEVLPLSSALVARIVKVGTNLDKVAERIKECNGSMWTDENDCIAIDDANALLMDIYYAFTGEDEQKPETTGEHEKTGKPIGTREQPKPVI